MSAVVISHYRERVIIWRDVDGLIRTNQYAWFNVSTPNKSRWDLRRKRDGVNVGSAVEFKSEEDVLVYIGRRIEVFAGSPILRTAVLDI